MSIPLPATTLAAKEPRTRPQSLTKELREEVVCGLHMGRLRAGDRLPSIRALARQRGIDHRAVAQAYRALAQEGLVEVRGRSGVCVASPSAVSEPPLAGDWIHWVAGIMAAGWQRSLSYPDLAALLTRCSTTSGLRCVCVESNRDQMLAYETEIGAATGMTIVPVYLDPDDREEVRDDRRRHALREVLATARLVVTTQYHATAVRAAMGELELPLVALRINPQLAEAVRSRIRSHGLTVLAATSQFGQRLRLMYGDSILRPEQLRIVLAGDRSAVARIPGDEPILISRAARELLPDFDHPSLVFPHSPTLAPETIVELTETVVRLNLQRGAEYEVRSS